MGRRVKTSFNGRVYLRQDYTTNIVYDDISYSFTGIGKTYTLFSNGQNVTGTRVGDGILLVNQVYQTPTTQNNSNNNYEFIENVGITSVVFSGIEDPDTDVKIISPSDVNQNNLPRGGIIVANEIAKKLNCTLDVVISKKITPSGYPEYGIGAITPDGTIYKSKNWNFYFASSL